ncbi:hypothetical protein ANN_10554 [Periplaneta americana]|uniref:Uncharacterized protein n=1 Tax=Periplaneta americana TaxID=6978 RepID=A0ABQ8TQX8_PERAM|nr:hypothetical protein ANN_10554 [Periplaneta americana]
MSSISGRGLSIWDTYTHNRPQEIKDHSSGDVAALSYFKYKEDNRLIRQMGMQFYRVSISWSRIMPTGLPNNISRKGVEHYHKVFDDMANLGIIPVVTYMNNFSRVTMYHWDLPQYMQDLGGWANPSIIKYFKEYARFLFQEYGAKVKYWLTINEPDLVALGYEGPYASAPRAPSVDAPGVGYYLAGHNLVLSHAAVYHLYDDEFRDKQKGEVAYMLLFSYFFCIIGRNLFLFSSTGKIIVKIIPVRNGNISIPLQAFWYEPLNPKSAEDKAAAERMNAQTLGWFSQPIFGKNGDYPQIMKDTIAQRSKEEGFPWSRLPEFTPQEIEYVKENLLQIAPQGLRRQLNYIKQKYGNWDILITENGYGDAGDLDDENRIIYHGQLSCVTEILTTSYSFWRFPAWNFLCLQTYLTELLKAMCLDNVPVVGYAVWSLIDNFQWRVGYT